MLDRTTLVTTLEYHDTEQTTEPGGVRTWLMTPDKCVLNSYWHVPFVTVISSVDT